MKIEILERLPVLVAYLRYSGPFGEPLGKFWRATVSPWLAAHDLVDCPRYGITLDNPISTPPEMCRYEACVELSPGVSPPDAETKTLAGGKYAVTTFKGTSAGIGAAWDAFRTECHAGKAPPVDGARQPFEHYPRGAVFDPKTGVFACELCLPVGS